MRASWLRRIGVLFMIIVLLSVAFVPVASATSSAGAGCPPVYYRIVRGDNLTRIASRYGVSVWQVQRWNGITNPDRIYIGSVLVIYPNRCAPPRPVPPKPVPPPHPVPPYWPPPPQPPHPVPPVWPPVPPSWPGWPSACPDQRAVIASPAQGSHVSGMVTINGNATHENFSFYKLEYGAGTNPSTWSWFFGGEFPIWHGTLGALNTDVLPSGTYTVRVTVVDKTSNYPPPCQVTIVVR